MIVLKLGGSLAKSGQLLKCLDFIERQYRDQAVVLTPGGGEFADQVRQAQAVWGVDDGIAHAMAILAMQQMALLMQGLKPGFRLVKSVSAICEQLTNSRIIIWSPDVAELTEAGVPASWDVTSDSLAAWLANRLHATELVLIKSADINPTLSLPELIDDGVVDPAFAGFTAQASFVVKLINADQFHG